jgi:hypothetical protein
MKTATAGTIVVSHFRRVNCRWLTLGVIGVKGGGVDPVTFAILYSKQALHSPSSATDINDTGERS